MAAKRKSDVLVPSSQQNGDPRPFKRQHVGSEDYLQWDSSDVCEFLQENGVEAEIISYFIGEGIDGYVLPELNEERLERMGLDTMGKRLKVLKIIQQLCGEPSIRTTTHNPAIVENMKIFNDSIHGHIELHPLCVKLIDTPQFQRLRHIKQLGGCYYVFPGASNNRFEHSLGVCYLAGKLVRALQNRQPELHITNIDCLCVQIAGLCHDLGHGPFSHMFDGKFIPMVRKDIKWKHEEASVKMFEYLLEDNDLILEFEKYGLTETDRKFIKEQIAGPLENDNHGKQIKLCQYVGRGPEKSFLYEIVANKRNGIDVDKWDYFARDCHHLGINNGFDHKRFMKFARVIKVQGELQICTRDKEVQNLYDMFATRQSLHRRAYQHPVSKVVDQIQLHREVYQHNIKLSIEHMISEALVKANDYIKIPGEKGKLLKMSECIDDMVAYTKLTDHIFHQILYSPLPEMEEAQKILRNVEKRKLYKCVGQTQPKHDSVSLSEEQTCRMPGEIATAVPIEDLCSEVRQFSDDVEETSIQPLQEEDFVVLIVNLDYGMKKENPIDKVRFYSKNNPEVPIQFRKDEVSKMLPQTFAEQHIRVFCKKLDPVSLLIAKICFNKWCELRGDMDPPKGGDNFAMELTPIKSSQSSQQNSQGFQPINRGLNAKEKLPFSN